MSRHCRECGSLMQHRRRTFKRPGGYYCLNRDCPNSRLFRYRSVKGKIVKAQIRAFRLRQAVSVHE